MYAVYTTCDVDDIYIWHAF